MDEYSRLIPAEIELIRSAIDKCGREIVLSLLPGPTPLEFAEHVKAIFIIIMYTFMK